MWGLALTATNQRIDLPITSIGTAEFDRLTWTFYVPTGVSGTLSLALGSANVNRVALKFNTDVISVTGTTDQALSGIVEDAVNTFAIVQTSTQVFNYEMNGSVIATGVEWSDTSFAIERIFKNVVGIGALRFQIELSGSDTYDWNGDLSGGTGTDFPEAVSNAVATQVNFATDDSQWADYAVSTNTKPIAVVGVDQNITTGVEHQLDGSGSNDGDGDSLTYLWSLTVPVGSSATLSATNIVNPTFTPDIDGDYIPELVVHDGTESSDPATDTLTASGLFDWSSVPLVYNVNEGEIFNLDGGTPTAVNGFHSSRPYLWDYDKVDNSDFRYAILVNTFQVNDSSTAKDKANLTAPNVSEATAIYFRYTLQDANNNEESRIITINVSPVAETIDITASSSVTNDDEGATVNLSVVNNTTTTRRIKWTQLSGHMCDISDRFAANPTITLPNISNSRKPFYAEDIQTSVRNLLPSSLPTIKGLDHLLDISYAGCYQMTVTDGNGESTTGIYRAIGIDAANQKIAFAVKNTGLVGEYNLPASFYTGDDYAQAPTIALTQDLFDIRSSYSIVDSVAEANASMVSGILYYNDKILITTGDTYDADGDRVDHLQVFTASDIDDGNATGYWRVEGDAKIAGYMSELPSNIATELGETHMIGWSSNYSIVSRYSVGQSFATFNPNDAITQDINTNRIIDTTSYMEFSLDNPVEFLSDNEERILDRTGNIWDVVSDSWYMFVVPNTRYLLAVGRHGGMDGGTAYKGIAKDGSDNNDAGFATINEDDRNYYWVYDLDEILGATNVYDPRPISVGNFPVPFCNDHKMLIEAAAFDNVNNQLHVIIGGNAGGSNTKALACVFNVTAKADVNDLPVAPTDCVFECKVTDTNGHVATQQVTVGVNSLSQNAYSSIESTLTSMTASLSSNVNLSPQAIQTSIASALPNLTTSLISYANQPPTLAPLTSPSFATNVSFSRPSRLSFPPKSPVDIDFFTVNIDKAWLGNLSIDSVSISVGQESALKISNIQIDENKIHCMLSEGVIGSHKLTYLINSGARVRDFNVYIDIKQDEAAN